MGEGEAAPSLTWISGKLQPFLLECVVPRHKYEAEIGRILDALDGEGRRNGRQVRDLHLPLVLPADVDVVDEQSRSVD